MIPLAIDENFNNDILRGALRRNPQLDIVRVQDFGLAGAEDPYERADVALRQRLLMAIRKQGSPEMAWAILHQPASPRTDADWRALLQTLLRTEDRPRLWDYVREAPAWWSHVAVRALQKRGWGPDAPLYRALVELPRQSRQGGLPHHRGDRVGRVLERNGAPALGQTVLAQHEGRNARPELRPDETVCQAPG